MKLGSLLLHFNLIGKKLPPTFLPLPRIPTSSVITKTMTANFSISANNNNRQTHRQKEKVVVVMGPTGSGKSRLSIDLATRFPGEVINSDKIQVYKGLNITTNKMPEEERLGVPHHLLGEIDSVSHGEFTPAQFRARGSQTVSWITGRGLVPYIVGGSNSFIYALLTEKYNPDSDVFTGSEPVSNELRYKCCFLWVDVSLPVLDEYLKKRVDEMVDSRMVDELARYYHSDDIINSAPNTGLRKAIGVPELEKYLTSSDTCNNKESDSVREEAVRAIKENTCRLAKTQMEKIQRLRGAGWDLKRVDGTDAFRAVLEGGSKGNCWSDVWERQVVKPSMKIVRHFLEEE